jgi:hypothetical protein
LKRYVIQAVFFMLACSLNIPIANGAYVSGGNWLAGWANRIELTIDHTKIDADLTNFPVLVHLSESSGLNKDDVSAVFNELMSDANRKKIAITMSNITTQCYVEISYWSNLEEQAFLWVKVPSISSTIDTVLYLYYDHTQFDNNTYVGDVNSTPGEAVWSNGFTGVWHLTEISNGTRGEFKDSTSNHNNGYGAGGTQNPSRVISEIGLPVQSFDGIDDYLIIPDNDYLSVPTPGVFVQSHNISLYDLEVTTKPTGYCVYMGKVVAHANLGELGMEWFWEVFNESHPTRSSMFNWYVGDSVSYYQSTANIRKIRPLAINQWYNNVVICTTTSSKSGVMYAYQDGLHHGEESSLDEYGIDYQNGPAPLRIGNYVGESVGDFIHARISEVRISNVTHSVAWIKADSYSQKDNLLSLEVNYPPVLEKYDIFKTVGIAIVLISIVVVFLFILRVIPRRNKL